MIGLKRGNVLLSDHEKEWEIEAEKTISLLKSILGDSAEDIQHVGSTAITSIKAKPIIDIAVAANDFDNVLKLNDELQKSGFYYREANSDNEKLLYACGSYYDGSGDKQTHFVHVVKPCSIQWQNYISFRDYLNDVPSAAKRYEALKVLLASKASDSGRSEYTSGKHDLIDELLHESLMHRKNDNC